MSIIDPIKTIGKIGVPLGHRDDSRNQPDVGERENHPGGWQFYLIYQFCSSTGKPNFWASFEDL